MKSFNRIIWTALLPFLLISCGKESLDGGKNSKLTEREVIGAYYYLGHSGPLTRELEIAFDEGHIGDATEMSYGSNGNLLSAYKYVFSWNVKGNKVLLNGTYAWAHSDGDVGGSDAWKAEFDYAYGMLIPGEGFIEGYGEKLIYEKQKEDVWDHIRCNVTYYKGSAIAVASIESGIISEEWPGELIKYGFTETYGTEYDWLIMEGDEITTFTIHDGVMDLFYAIIRDCEASRQQKGYLSEGEKSLLKTAKNAIDEHINDISNGNTWYFAAYFGVFFVAGRPYCSNGNTIQVPTYYTFVDGEIPGDSGSSSGNGNSSTSGSAG